MSYEGHKNLWAGVIGQALRDLLFPEIEYSKPEDRAIAYDWLVSDSEATYSYLWACDVTDIHPDIARRRLREAGLL